MLINIEIKNDINDLVTSTPCDYLVITNDRNYKYHIFDEDVSIIKKITLFDNEDKNIGKELSELIFNYLNSLN